MQGITRMQNPLDADLEETTSRKETRLKLIFAHLTFWLLIAQKSIKDTRYHAKAGHPRTALFKKKMQCKALIIQFVWYQGPGF